MTKTIQEAVSPLLIVGSFCGLGFFEYPFGQSRPYFTYSYFLIMWSLYTYLFYYLVYTSYTAYLFVSWFNIIIIITAVMSMLVSFFRFKELKMCLRKLSIVDDTLELLGTPKEYRRLYNWIIGIITGWIALVFLTNASDSLWLNYEYFSLTRICVPFVANHLIHINTLNVLTWVIILRYTGSRFQRINEYIHDILDERTKGRNKLTLQLIDGQRIDVKTCKEYIWILRHVHLQLCLISRELNKIFSIPMTLEMGCYFVLFVDVFRHIYRSYIDRNTDVAIGQVLDNMFTCIWGMVHNAKFLALNLMCQTLCNKANETMRILYKLFENPEEDLREQILQFILQIKQRELTFSGMGLFIFGSGFVRKFYASVVTVLVIIIQMNVPNPYHTIPPSNVVLMVYYDKKFRKCLKRIAIVDDTLAQFGITTNYQKLRKRTTWLILGWFMSIIVLNSGETLWLRQYNLNTLIVICAPYIQNYCYHINFVDDLIIISILGYIGLKFDQINENVQKIMKNNKIRQVGKNRMLQSRQRRLSGTPSKKHVLWIVIHLHLELCKISREINSIFGIQMTLKMGLYFGFITANLCEIFDVILIENYCKLKVEFFVLLSLWIVFHVLKLFFINYVCEKVSAKASTTGNVINIASYSICDVEIRENILQFLLQLTQAPLRFYGLGLFQFGFKFLQGFLSSVATVIIILIQAHVNK
ncbi:uncharacterized protein [Anoplolepis gracilipes]|uniref:uncharacterized protein n=1 Tax=Anoplolepis gracilipes TaxID=354296 RepID=UPI003B9F34C5